MPAWVTQAYSEYAKRLPRELAPQLCEIPLSPRGKNGNVSGAKSAEGDTLLNRAAKNVRLIALDARGRAWSTEDLAQQLADWQLDGRDLAFMIGGPDGLSPACLQQAECQWSLSTLTLPHPLVRVIFIEQLYRAWTINQNHPYHK